MAQHSLWRALVEHITADDEEENGEWWWLCAFDEMQSINLAKNSIVGRGVEFIQGPLFWLIIAKCSIQLLYTNSAKDCRVQGSCCSGLLLRCAVHLMIMCKQCNSARELLFWLITAIRSGEWQEGRKFPLPTSSSDGFDNYQGSSNCWLWGWWGLLRLGGCAFKSNLNFMESLILIHTSLAFPLKQASNPRECNILQCRVIKVLLIAGQDKGSRLFKAEHM